MKKSIVSGYMAALLFMGVAGCERKNGDAIVKDYVAGVRQGEEIKDSGRPIARTMDREFRMRDNGRTIQVCADRAQWYKLRQNDRVKVTYRAGESTGTVWDAEIQ